MVKPMDWTALQKRVDFIVDGRFAEPVILIPWLGGEDYTPDRQGPDPSRKILITTGMNVTPGAKLIGESGRATGGTGGGFNTQILEQEVWLSITLDKIGSIRKWVAYDRVYFVMRDQFYTISYVEGSATLRPNIHLIAANDMVTGEGSPVGEVTPVSSGPQLYFDTLAKKFYRATADTNNDWVKL